MPLLAIAAAYVIASPTGGSSEIDPSTIASDDALGDLGRTHTPVSFSVLADLPPVRGTGLVAGLRAPQRWRIPDHIQRLSGTAVAVDGYMLPLDFNNGTVNRFLLNASYDMCQFGAPSSPTERIDVTLTGGRRTLFTHRAVRVYGTLTVREEIDGGEVVGLYTLAGVALGPPGLGY